MKTSRNKSIEESLDEIFDLTDKPSKANKKIAKKPGKRKLERHIQNEIFTTVGSMENIILFRNSVGLLDAVRSDGNVQRIKQGLGEGSPDLIGCVKLKNGLGQFFAIEVKRPGCELRENQVKCHEKWRKFGIRIFTATSKEEAVEFVENMIKECNST